MIHFMLKNSTFKAIFANGTKGDFFYKMEELDSVINFINNTWNDPEDNSEEQYYENIDDLLDGTGIQLED